MSVLLVIAVFCPWSMAQAPSKSISPLFWQLDYKGQTSYAFGSIHLGEKAMYPLPKAVMAGFNASDALAVEVNLAEVDQSKMTKLILRFGVDQQRPLAKWLNPPLQKQYAKYCDTHLLPCERFKSFKPWLVSLTLMNFTFAQSGFDAELGIDKFFINKAGDKKPIIALESAELQLGIFAGLPMKIQRELLAQSMTTDVTEMRAMLKNWTIGDMSKLIELFSKTSDEAIEKVFYEQLLVKRNVQMVEKLMTQFNTGKSLFVVVGTAHFVGERNMLALLQDKDVKVTPHVY
jgi:uncharacterized protein YbaP (TraB family)